MWRKRLKLHKFTSASTPLMEVTLVSVLGFVLGTWSQMARLFRCVAVATVSRQRYIQLHTYTSHSQLISWCLQIENNLDLICMHACMHKYECKHTSWLLLMRVHPYTCMCTCMYAYYRSRVTRELILRWRRTALCLDTSLTQPSKVASSVFHRWYRVLDGWSGSE